MSANHAELAAGRVIASTSFTFGGNAGAFRHDLAACSSDPVIVDPAPTNNWYVGSGQPRFYARRRTGELNGVWALTEGSTYLTHVSGTAGAGLSPGALMTGDGIPEGTYLRRIFSDAIIEMSAPATATAASQPVTFAAFPAETRQTVRFFDKWNGGVQMQLNKYTKDDVFVFDVLRLGSQSSTGVNHCIRLNTASGFEPGTFMLHETKDYRSCFWVYKGHVAFSTNSQGKAGIGKLRTVNSSSTARLSVPDADVTAEIGELEVNGTMTKDGPGALSATLVSNVCDSIVVEEGTLVLAMDHDVVVTNLSVAANATLVKRGAGSLTPLNFTRFGAVRIEEGEFVIDCPEASFENVPSGSFFHLDASQTNTMTFFVRNGTNTFVDCWRDVNGGPIAAVSRRKTDQNYSAGYLRENALNGLSVVDYGPLKKGSTAWAIPVVDRTLHNFARISEDGTWSVRDYTNAIVREAFIVIGSSEGGNVVLGGFESGKGLNRTVNTNYAEPIYSNNNFPGEVRLNGKTVNPRTTGLSSGYDVLSITVNSGVNANVDSFATFNQCRFVGGQQLGEVILYERTLTPGERTAVNCYLLKKWFNRQPPYAFDALTLAGGSIRGVHAAIETAALDGYGTVAGSLKLHDDATVKPMVDADGNILPIAASGSVSLAGGMVVLSADAVAKLKPREYTLITGAGGVTSTGDWMVSTETECNYSVRVDATENALTLLVKKNGTCIYIR